MEAGTVITCERAPLSDQFANTYCVLLFPCVAVVAMVCWLPGIHEKVWGEVYAVPSALMVSPEGLVAIVTDTGRVVTVTVQALAGSVGPLALVTTWKVT